MKPMPQGYSKELIELCSLMLQYDPAARPSSKEITQKILSSPFINAFQETNTAASLRLICSLSNELDVPRQPPSANGIKESIN